jgi:hypothetical protein
MSRLASDKEIQSWDVSFKDEISIPRLVSDKAREAASSQ